MEEKRYEAKLLAKGIPADNILKYDLILRGRSV